MKKIVLGAVVALSLTATAATAAVYDFEDIGGFGGRASFPSLGITNTYLGWSWPSASSGQHWAVVENSDGQFENARSGTQALWNWSDGGVRNIVFDTLKSVTGAYFSVFDPGATWSADTIQFKAYDAVDALIGTSSILNLDNSTAQGNVWLYLAANFEGVKRLEILSTNDEFGGRGWWAMDDLEIGESAQVIPVPASLPMVLAALGMTGLLASRRKSLN